MSNLIPPLLSSSPPPIVGPLDEEDDDEFGDFRTAADSYDCDDFSLPPSPQKSPVKDFSKVNLDINSNNSEKILSTTEMPITDIKESVVCEVIDKDFQDRRKNVEDEPVVFELCEIEVNCSSSSQSVALSTPFDTHINKETVQNVVVEVLDDLEQSTEIVGLKPNINQINDLSHNVENDEYTDLQCGVSCSIDNNCDEVEHKDISDVEIEPIKIISDVQGQDDLNECNIDDFSEKTNTDMTNEIKSEDDLVEEIVNQDSMKFEVDFGDSSKEIHYEDMSESSMSIKVCETDPKLSDDDDDEFGDFENHFGRDIEDILEKEKSEIDDFVNPSPPPKQSSNVEDEDDDFGDFESSDLTRDDFGDFATGPDKPEMMDLDIKNAAAKSETILKEIFVVTEDETDDYEYIDETKGNPIFDELKDVTETNALIYQWSKSNSQKMFLKALNIDLRNILYGPAWNCTMPRFAANLGLTPLEPVKSEILTPTPVQNVSSPSISSQKNNGDIPTAQFDWSGSGLVNPLDYLEQLVASLEIQSTNPTSNQSPSPSNELLDEWDLWLQSTSTDPPGNIPEDSSQLHVKPDFLPTTSDKADPISSLFDSETLEKPSKEQTVISGSINFELSKPDEKDDFSPFQSPKIMPLRETYISNENNDKPGWLQPTILTPDLPRKEAIIDQDEDDDEFDDFQMVLPEDNKIDTIDLTEFDTISKIVPVNKNFHNQEHIFDMPKINSGPIDSSVQNQPNDVNNVDDDDDEFTDFHSSLPPPSNILNPLQPVPLEPLKPSIQYSTPTSTQINWPEPGVTDEDIKHIELTYSRKTESKLESPKTKPEISKENSLDDDEWSDFVSVTNPIKPALPERTATPDLPLSVLNLNNVQAPKQPIPVITPSGLVQTKLSSNLMLQPKSSNVVQTAFQPNIFKPQPTQFQPSIISNQFAANLGLSSLQPSKTNQNQTDDDDDWSDFVSSQPLPNGYQQKPTSQGKPPQVNWTNATTNIIMNPSHFDSFQSFVPQQNNKKVTTLPGKNTIPSISALPDLDFIAPKNRTSKK